MTVQSFSLIKNIPIIRQLKTKSQRLNALVSQLSIIQREDSLQKVARMSEH